MALAGGLITVLIVGEHRWLKRRDPARAETPAEVPYGVAIAIAGLLAINEPILNHLA
jgi:prepilin peptidase CpaA